MKIRDQQRYWITGASSGIGYALTLELVQKGHEVIVSSRNKESLDKLALKYPGMIQVLPCDVANDKEMANLFIENLPALNHLDGIFLCAGICEYIDLPNFNIASFKKAFSVNFQGTVNSCAAAYHLLDNSALRKQGEKPFILGLCSMSSYLGFPRAEAYGASKAAMAYFLNSLRADIGERIDVIPVFLGFVDTPMTAQNDFPMPFIVSPEEAAKGILNKLKKRPLRINFPWRLHVVLNIFSKLQRLWYWYIIPILRRFGSPPL